MKIVLFGNNRAAVNVLRELLKRPSDDIRVVVPAGKVVHEWHESLYDFSKNAGIKYIYDSEQVNNNLFTDEMRAYQPDVFLSIYYDQLLGQDLLAIPRLGAFNVHPSLLPKYRGTAPIIWAIANGEEYTGVTFHVMEPKVDTGDIVLQQQLAIAPNDTGYSVHMKCAELVRTMLPAFLLQLDFEKFNRVPQQGVVSHYRKSDGKLNALDWNQSSQRLYNIVRALTKPLPGGHAYLRGEKCFLWSVRNEQANPEGVNPESINPESINKAESWNPGELYINTHKQLYVKTGDAWLRIDEVGMGGLHLHASDLVERLGLHSHDQFEQGKKSEPALTIKPEITPGRAFIPFGVPSIGPEEIEEVTNTLKSGWIGMGNKTMLFEDQFRQYTGAKHAVSVSSCTAALHLALWANGIRQGDEVITTAMTFAATVSAIILCGAKPVLVDIDPNTLNINPSAIEAAISPRTRAILPVHFGGLPCAMDRINAIAKQHNLIVIEDAAHSISAEFGGKKIGDGVNVSCFSFYANKNLTTGEGGMITTNDDALAEKLRIMRLHGLSGHAWKRYLSKEIMFSMVVMPGYKYNMTDMQASLGIHQLRKLDGWLIIREQYADIYDTSFKRLPGVQLQQRKPSAQIRHALHLYVLVLDPAQFDLERNAMVAELRQRNIGAAIHYPAVHTHPYFHEVLDMSKDPCRIAAAVGESILTLPMTPAMTEAQIHYVAENVVAFCQAHHKPLKIDRSL